MVEVTQWVSGSVVLKMIIDTLDMVELTEWVRGSVVFIHLIWLN